MINYYEAQNWQAVENESILPTYKLIYSSFFMFFDVLFLALKLQEPLQLYDVVQP